MPAVIPAIAAWAGTTVTVSTLSGVVIASVTYGTLVEAAIIAGSIAYSAAENRRIRNQLNALSADRGRDVMSRDPLAYRRLIYGQIRTTGPILYMATEGTKNENLHLVIALASHECDDLGEITLDNNELVPLDGGGNATGKYAGYITIKKFTGTTTQAASAELQAAFPGVWTANHHLFGIAYLHVKLKYSADLFPNGMPTIKCLVRGKKLWDPRANPSDTTIRTWSCNSALCTADYLNDAAFGRAVAWSRINAAALIEAANVCDESIGLADSFTRQCDYDVANKLIGMTTQVASQLDGLVVGMQVNASGIPSGSRITSIHNVGPDYFFAIDRDPTVTHVNTTVTFGLSENRYETHGTVTSDQLADSVILDLGGAMAGHVVDMGGIWTIRAGAYRTPTVSLDESHMIGPMSMVPRTSRKDNYNGVKGTYISPFNQWVASDFPAVKNDTYMSWDGGIRLWKDVVLPFTISPSASQRLAKIDLERGRQQIQVEQNFKLHAFECMCFDTVRITKTELGWTNKEFEVTNWKLVTIMDSGQIALGVALSLRETAAGVWDWADGSETTVDLAANTSLPSPANVPTPTGLALTNVGFLQDDGKIQPRVRLNWNASGNIYMELNGFTLVEYKRSADSVWIQWNRVRGTMVQDYLTDVKYGTNLDVRITYFNQLGVQSNNNGASTTPTYNTVSSFAVTGDSSAPATPSGLAYATGTGKAVSLSWNSNTEVDLDEYIVYRSTDNVTFTEVGRASANRFVDILVVIGTAYYYKIAAIDWSANISTLSSSVGPATPGTIGAGSVDSTPPSNPAALTVSSSGTRIAGDGTILSYFIVNVPAMPAGAVGLNIFMRKQGAADWMISDQKDAGGGTVNIDDLTPGTVYDLGVQAFSVFGYTSSIVALNTQTAPDTTSAPANPSGGAITADGVVAKRYPGGNSFLFGSVVTWDPNTELDFDHYEVESVATFGDPDIGTSGSAWNSYDGAAQPYPVSKGTSFTFYNNVLNPGYVYLRAVNRSGLPSAWVYVGNNNSAASRGAGTVGVRDVGAGATNIPTSNKVAGATNIVTLAGGSAEESFNIDVTAWGFSAKPSSLGEKVQSDRNYHIRYDWDDGGNTSTNAVVKISRFDGANTTAGNLRIGINPRL